MSSASSACNSKVNMFNKNNLFKLNNSMPYHGNKRNLNGIPRFIQVEIIGTLNGSKSTLNDVF